MTVQKFIKCSSLNIDGQFLNNEYNLKLKILDASGNYLIHKNIIRHQVLQKQSNGSTKTRSEVKGGGKKPWQQKGTGRARAGSNRSPLWKGGGVIFGPKPKIEILKINKKERVLALKTLLYNKKNRISIIEDLESNIKIPNTKVFIHICQKCGIDLTKKVLVIVLKKTTPFKLATRNVKNVELISVNNLNTLSLLKAKQILLSSTALKNIKEKYCE